MGPSSPSFQATGFERRSLSLPSYFALGSLPNCATRRYVRPTCIAPSGWSQLLGIIYVPSLSWEKRSFSSDLHRPCWSHLLSHQQLQDIWVRLLCFRARELVLQDIALPLLHCQDVRPSCTVGRCGKHGILRARLLANLGTFEKN